MASTLPSVSDCCSLCEGLSVTVDTSAGLSIRQVYSGNGDPNGVLIPDDPTLACVYNNLDVPSEQWWWIIDTQTWV